MTLLWDAGSPPPWRFSASYKLILFLGCLVFKAGGAKFSQKESNTNKKIKRVTPSLFPTLFSNSSGLGRLGVTKKSILHFPALFFEFLSFFKHSAG